MTLVQNPAVAGSISTTNADIKRLTLVNMFMQCQVADQRSWHTAILVGTRKYTYYKQCLGEIHAPKREVPFNPKHKCAPLDGNTYFGQLDDKTHVGAYVRVDDSEMKNVSLRAQSKHCVVRPHHPCNQLCISHAVVGEPT